MMTRSIITFALVLASLFTLSFSAQAGEKDFGEYQVHWSVFPSTFLAPEIAQANDLQRSNGIGIVNISIMEKDENGQPVPVNGQVQGKVTNDIQQVKFLAFRRIKEGDAVYFIAQYQHRAGDLMTFNITASPTGHDEDLPIRFSHTLFND